MQIVIDIPDDKWKSYQPYKGLPYDNIMDNSVRYIADGTPLPKGHGDLKDVSKFIYNCDYNNGLGCDVICHCDNCIHCIITEKAVNAAPTIIEADGGGKDDR